MQFCFLFAILGGVCYGNIRVEVPALPAFGTRTFPSLEARFGPGLPHGGRNGTLLQSEPSIYNCEESAQRAPPNAVALIKRGSPDARACDFDRKVLNAEHEGFAAAIVFDDGASHQLIPMAGSGVSVKIPSVFVSEQTGKELLELLELAHNESAAVIVTLLPDPPPQWTALVITFITMVSIGIFFFIVFMYFRRRRVARIIARTRLNTCDIDKFAVRLQGPDPSDDTCCICLAEYEEGDKILALPCNHEFHKDCIVPWLTERRRVCPICKRDPSPSETTPLLESGPVGETTPLLAAADDADEGEELQGARAYEV